MSQGGDANARRRSADYRRDVNAAQASTTDLAWAAGFLNGELQARRELINGMNVIRGRSAAEVVMPG